MAKRLTNKADLVNGTITATRFVGDGSGLTNLPAATVPVNTAKTDTANSFSKPQTIGDAVNYNVLSANQLVNTLGGGTADKTTFTLRSYNKGAFLYWEKGPHYAIIQMNLTEDGDGNPTGTSIGLVADYLQVTKQGNIAVRVMESEVQFYDVNNAESIGRLYYDENTGRVSLENVDVIPPTPQAVRAALLNAPASAWANGELTGMATPAGSIPNMRFAGPAYRYEYMNGMNDPDGSRYTWVRTAKA